MKQLTIILILSLACFTGVFAQYPPPPGNDSTTAMHWDSTAFIGWATSCVVQRGYITLRDTSFTYEGHNHAYFGAPEDATGKVDSTLSVVSLGDGGTAILQFAQPLGNGPGPDFAVFENGLSDQFLEFAFVEVSSDGVHYVRFPNVSLTQDTVQITNWGGLNTRRINNLAGKYRALYGTPFDLEELRDSAVDVYAITHIKLIDVVGSISDTFARYDTYGHKINDPWPTPFLSCGFDLDGVGVIHFTTSIDERSDPFSLQLYPNPFHEKLIVEVKERGPYELKIATMSGTTVLQKTMDSDYLQLDLGGLPGGIYLFSLEDREGHRIVRKIARI